MPRHSYPEHDSTFGQAMFKLSRSIILTQVGLTDLLGVSRQDKLEQQSTGEGAETASREGRLKRSWYQMSFSVTSLPLRDHYGEMALGGTSGAEYRNAMRATLLVGSRSLVSGLDAGSCSSSTGGKRV